MSGETVSRFEDLIAWQKARGRTRPAYGATRNEAFARDFGLSYQIQRAFASIMYNIAESFLRRLPAEFHQFLSIAKSSCAEVRSHLYVALDAGYLSEPDFLKLQIQAEEVGRIVGGLRVAVERKLSAQNSRARTGRH